MQHFLRSWIDGFGDSEAVPEYRATDWTEAKGVPGPADRLQVVRLPGAPPQVRRGRLRPGQGLPEPRPHPPARLQGQGRPGKVHSFVCGSVFYLIKNSLKLFRLDE